MTVIVGGGCLLGRIRGRRIALLIYYVGHGDRDLS